MSNILFMLQRIVVTSNKVSCLFQSIATVSIYGLYIRCLDKNSLVIPIEQYNRESRYIMPLKFPRQK